MGGKGGPLAQVSLQATRLADDTWHFAGWPDAVAFDPSALVLLTDPFTFPAHDFLQWPMRGATVWLPVIGGNASGGRGPGGSRRLGG